MAKSPEITMDGPGKMSEAAIIRLQRKQEAQFICSACGADRGCDCNAPAVEKLAEKLEQDRQRAKRARERKKDEQNQPSRHVTNDAEVPVERRKAEMAALADEEAALREHEQRCDRMEARCAARWRRHLREEERNAVSNILKAIQELTDEQRALLFQTLKDSYQWP
jgi:hypothetical protein